MKTYCGSTAGSLIEPILWNAQESVWITSPWIGKYYAEKLASLAEKGVEVRVITCNIDYNKESLAILRAHNHLRVFLLVLDKDEVAFIHSKIYIVDKKHAISGSANLTNSGLNYNVESLNIAKDENEFQQLEMDFMRLWMQFENERLSGEELSRDKYYAVKDALPISINYGEIDNPKIQDRKLVYFPYYLFQYSFRTTVGNSPPKLFENKGFVLVDGKTRVIENDHQIIKEIQRNHIDNYSLRPNNKYSVTLHKPMIRSFQEAEQLAYDFIIKHNTRSYKQKYYNKTVERIFVPYQRIIRLIKSEYVLVPFWYIEVHDSDGTKRVEVILASSGEKWDELLICPDCQTKINIDDAKSCKACGKKMCSKCVKTEGLIFKKNYCNSCLVKSKNSG